MKVINKPSYRLNGIEIDTARECLNRSGEAVYLRRQTFQVLLYLLERRERVVGKQELIEALWKDTAVTDNVLLQCVMDIRKALGDDPRQPRWIKTYPKTGYRFIGEIEEISADGFAIEETEEITAVEFEFREEIAGEVAQAGPSAALAPAVLPGRLRNRQLLHTALALLILLSGALAIYAGLSWWQASRPVVETALPLVPGKRAVAVMCFVNQSATAELDWLREGLTDMLITNLSRSDKVAVLSRQQLYTLLERIGRRPTDELQLEEAIDIARRSKADTILMGCFIKLGETVRIETRIIDAATGRLLAAESLTADKPDHILQQVDLLSLKLASHLGVVASEQEPKAGLAEVMTESLEAYRDYTLALAHARAYHSVEAIGLLEKAVALDPQFAMAHARLGYVYAISGGLSAEKGKRYLEKAFQMAQRLTDRDRLYITLWYAMANGGDPGTIPSMREIIKRYPYDIEMYYQLSYTLRNASASS